MSEPVAAAAVDSDNMIDYVAQPRRSDRPKPPARHSRPPGRMSRRGTLEMMANFLRSGSDSKATVVEDVSDNDHGLRGGGADRAAAPEAAAADERPQRQMGRRGSVSMLWKSLRRQASRKGLRDPDKSSQFSCSAGAVSSGHFSVASSQAEEAALSPPPRT